MKATLKPIREAKKSARETTNRNTPPDAWTSVDQLGEALHFLRMSGIFYTCCEFTTPWGLDLPPMRGFLMFHFVTSGQCWLSCDGVAPRRLQPGDLALVPRADGHTLSSEPGTPAGKLFDLPREAVSDRYEILRYGGGGQEEAHLICGAVRFEHPAAHQLVALLPPVISVDARSLPHPDWIQSTLRFMAAEAKALRPGGETIITRLADILVIQVIRSWMARDPAAQTGWLRALRDPQIGRAIARIHHDPARAWTVSALASEVAMSRSAFAACFTELVGEPAMHYVTRWRMYLALTWLREDGARLADVASRLGYESEAAFSRAFKRFMGVAPGAARRADQAASLVIHSGAWRVTANASSSR